MSHDSQVATFPYESCSLATPLCGGTTTRRGPSPPKAFQCIASLESPPPGETPPQAAEGVHFPRSQGGWLVFPSPAGRLYGFIIRAPLLFQGRQPRPFPPSEATQPFYTTLGTEGRKARWMPYVPLRRRRRPLREYRLAPPRRLVFTAIYLTYYSYRDPSLCSG